MTTHKKINAAWHIVEEYVLRECIGLFLALIIAAFGLAQPYILKKIIDFILVKDKNGAYIMIVVMIAVFFVTKALSVINTYIFMYVSESMLFDCRVRVYNKALNRGMKDEDSAGSIHSKILKELPQVVNLLTDTFANIIINLFSLVATFVLVYILDSHTALVLAISVPLVLLIIFIFNPLLKKINSDLLDEYSKINGVLMENIANRKGILYTNTHTYAVTRFTERLRHYIKLKYRRLLLSVISKYTLEMVYFIPTVLLLFYAVLAIENSAMTIGTLIALSSYLARFYSPLKMLTNMNFSFQQSLVAFERYIDYLSTDTTEDKYRECKKLDKVCLNNVFFSYGSKVVIENFSCSFKKGEITLVMGENGAGKTTLIDLIVGIIFADKGEVVYDGVNVCSIKKKDIASLVSVVSQHPYLYSDTVKENVMLGRDIKEIDMLKLGSALGFHDVLFSNDINIHTKLSEFGKNLSGGQMRRLSVLQGLVGNPDLVIYDEPLVNLDENSRMRMIEYIKSQKEKVITIIISHENHYEFADNVLIIN